MLQLVEYIKDILQMMLEILKAWKKRKNEPEPAFFLYSREFQYKLLNRCIATNAFLCKIGILASPACSFCGERDESLQHLFVSCHYTREFWAEVIKWFSDFNININELSDKSIMLGILDCEDYLFVNHILSIAKRHIYNCRIVETRPSLRVFIARVKVVYQLETKIAKSRDKSPDNLTIH